MPQTNKNSSELSKKNTKKIVEKYLSNINRKNSDTIFHSFKNSETNSELFDLRFSKKIINLNDRNGMKKKLSGSKLSIYDIFEIKEQLKLDKINENRRNLENEAKKCLVFSPTINSINSRLDQGEGRVYLISLHIFLKKGKIPKEKN